LKEENLFKIESEKLKNEQEINRNKATNETKRITKELEIKSKAQGESRRKLIETEGKLKIEKAEMENNFKKDMKKK
jgi:hypothetical protein